jgi:cytochrome P450
MNENIVFRGNNNNDTSSVGDDLLRVLPSILLGVALVGFSHRLYQRKKFIEKIERLPGPPLDAPDENPWLGHLAPLLATRGQIPNFPSTPLSLPLIHNLCKIYPDIFRFWVFGPFRVFFARPSIVVTDPNLIQQLLLDRTKASKLIKERRVYHIMDALVGNSILSLSDGPKWKHQRKIITPAFSQTFLEDANKTVAHLLYSEAFPSLEREGGTTEVLEWSTRVASEVLGLVGFSRSFDGFPDASSSDPQKTVSLFDNFNSLLKTMYHRVLSPPFIEWLPTKENWEFAKARSQLNNIISRIVRERLVEEDQFDTATASTSATAEKDGIRFKKHKDLLSYMMLKDEDGSRLSHQELFGNVRMFLFAGHDTSAATLAYALWELASHSEMQERLHQEVDEMFSKEPPPDSDDFMVIPAYKKIMQLQYLDAVVKETLRLHPPAAIAREVIEDITLEKEGGQTYTIPEGASIYIIPYYTQRLEPYFENPDDFRPERFLNADGSISSNAMRNPSYYPFSIGPRNCVGQPLATMELKTVLVHLIHRFVIRPNSKSTAPLPVMLMNVKPHEVLLDFQNRFDR